MQKSLPAGSAGENSFYPDTDTDKDHGSISDFRRSQLQT